MKKAAIVIMFLTIIVKISGFIRDITLSYFYGASTISDAYLISLTIPSFIFAFISVSITTAYIPVYSLLEERKGPRSGIEFTNNLLNLFLAISTLIVITGLIFTEFLVKLFASGFDGTTLELAVVFTRLSIIGVYFTVIMAVFRGFLHVKNSFSIPALVALPNNIIILLAIYFSAIYDNLYILGIGTLIGAFSQVLIMIPELRKKRFQFSFKLKLKDEYIRRFGIIAFPVILGVSVNEINFLIGRTIASRITEGAISALSYSFSLTQFVNGTFAAAIAIAMYPLISKMVIEKNIKGLNSTISESINMISVIVIPITAITIAFSEEIITMLYGRGAFDENAIMLTSSTLFYYSLGMLAYGYREILTRAFYANQDSKTPMINSAIAMILNIFLNIILSKYMGTSGLALASSIAGTFGSILLLINLNKKIIHINVKGISIVTLKVLIASALLYVIAINLNNLLLKINLNEFIALLISVVLALLAYILLLYVFRVKEVTELFKMLYNRLFKK